jgi:hypothetical protein
MQFVNAVNHAATALRYTHAERERERESERARERARESNFENENLVNAQYDAITPHRIPLLEQKVVELCHGEVVALLLLLIVLVHFVLLQLPLGLPLFLFLLHRVVGEVDEQVLHLSQFFFKKIIPVVEVLNLA